MSKSDRYVFWTGNKNRNNEQDVAFESPKTDKWINTM